MNPTITAATNDATNRASTICGRPGNATAVATNTTGLIAGAASRNVSAAGAGTPRATSRPATGTELHSHPGSAAAVTAATGTANAVRFGTTRASAPGATNADSSALTTTPS